MTIMAVRIRTAFLYVGKKLRCREKPGSLEDRRNAGRSRAVWKTDGMPGEPGSLEGRWEAG